MLSFRHSTAVLRHICVAFVSLCVSSSLQHWEWAQTFAQPENSNFIGNVSISSTTAIAWAYSSLEIDETFVGSALLPSATPALAAVASSSGYLKMLHSGCGDASGTLLWRAALGSSPVGTGALDISQQVIWQM